MSAMKHARLTVLAIGAIAAVALTFPAVARETFSFSFDTGAVAFAFSDGYWDNDHQWHGWRNSREAGEFRKRHPENYKAVKHGREKNQGWRRDDDHDGARNQGNRDHDGAPNRRDDGQDNRRRD